jgi:hypothetical protein
MTLAGMTAAANDPKPKNTRATASIRPDLHFIADFAEQLLLGSPSTFSSEREVHTHLQEQQICRQRIGLLGSSQAGPQAS